MISVFLLQHSYEKGQYEETKTIGIYSSKEKAQSVAEKYKLLPGFRAYVDAFYIDEYRIDQDYWSEGFI